MSNAFPSARHNQGLTNVKNNDVKLGVDSEKDQLKETRGVNNALIAIQLRQMKRKQFIIYDSI